MKSTLSLCAAIAALATSNALARTLDPPVGTESKQAVVTDRLPTKTETYGSHIEGTYFGVFGAKGSLGLGLLLGPIGVAANTAHVNKANQEAADHFSDLTKTDLHLLLQTVQTNAGGAAGTLADVHFELTPAALIGVKKDEPTFSLRCVVHANLMKNGKSTWHGRYLVIIDDTFMKDDAASVTRARESLPACLTEAYRLYTTHVDGGMREVSTHKVRFDDGKAYKTSVIAAEIPNHVIVSDVLGLMEYPRNALSD